MIDYARPLLLAALASALLPAAAQPPFAGNEIVAASAAEVATVIATRRRCLVIDILVLPVERLPPMRVLLQGNHGALPPDVPDRQLFRGFTRNSKP